MITCERFDIWAAAVEEDAENAHIGRFTDVTVALVDETGGAVVLHYEHGRLHVVGGTRPDDDDDVVAGGAGATGAAFDEAHCDADLVLRGPASAWVELLDPDAAPRRHDLLSLTKAPGGITVVRGREHLLRHLRVLTRLVEIGRRRG